MIKRPPNTRIELVEQGFYLYVYEDRTKIFWRDIEKINGYKIDTESSDEICLDIVTAKKVITISAEMIDWDLFTEKLHEVFPSVSKDWYAQIAQPVFPANYTTIYFRENYR